MPILHDPLFPEWPDACSPDRFRLRPVKFEPADDETVLTGTYTNKLAAAWAPQHFEIRVAGPDGERAKAFAEGLRVWFEAFEITDDMRESVSALGDAPPADFERRRPKKAGEGEDVAITVSVKRMEDGHERAYIFGVIDPDIDTVNRHERHDYERPSNGTARITVYRSTAQLQGVSPGPQTASAGSSTPRCAAGRYCSVYGVGTATYSISSAWEG